MMMRMMMVIFLNLRPGLNYYAKVEKNPKVERELKQSVFCYSNKSTNCKDSKQFNKSKSSKDSKDFANKNKSKDSKD